MAASDFFSGPGAKLPRNGAAGARLRWSFAALLALGLLLGGYALVLAQVAGDRGIAPTASSADIDVRGIEVDIRAATGEEARERAWRQVQGEAWRRVGGPPLPENQISEMVSAIVIERERIGPWLNRAAQLGSLNGEERRGRA